jgi:hypothetical protein
MNTGKAILIGLPLIALSLSGPAFAKSIFCRSKTILAYEVAYIFTLLLPTYLDGSITHINVYGDIDREIGTKVSVDKCDNGVLGKSDIFIKSIF